jgi:hypothetical protein
VGGFVGGFVGRFVGKFVGKFVFDQVTLQVNKYVSNPSKKNQFNCKAFKIRALSAEMTFVILNKVQLN